MEMGEHIITVTLNMQQSVVQHPDSACSHKFLLLNSIIQRSAAYCMVSLNG